MTTELERMLERRRALEPAVRASGLCHYYGRQESRRQVLFDCDLTLSRGEMVILTGPSGSGKTTLLTLIGALRTLEEGSLEVLGRQVRGMGRGEQVALRRRIGFIFQHHNLIGSLSAVDNVRIALQLNDSRAGDDERPMSLLHDLGLADFAAAKPQKLSGGQRQRVAIARALVNRPRLILADEPTAALDKDTAGQVIGLLRGLTEEGCTVLIVTHDARVIDAATRIVNMIDGRVSSDIDIEKQAVVCDVLRRCKVFADSSAQLLADVATHMLPESFPAGSDLVVQDSEGDKFYVLLEGRCEVVRASGGKSEILAELGPGDFFGELALLRDAPRAATVRSLEPVQLLSLSKDRFLRATDTDANLQEQLRRAALHY